MVEVASSWSAISTRAALTARTSAGVGLRAQPRPQPVGHGAGPRRPVGEHQGRPGRVGGGAAPGRVSASTIDAATRRGRPGHGRGSEVGPERVAGPGHHHRPAHPVRRRPISGGGAESRASQGRASGAAVGVAGRPDGLGAGPQPLGHLLEGRPTTARSVAGPSPVDRALVGQLGDRRWSRWPAGSPPSCPAGTGGPGARRPRRRRGSAGRRGRVGGEQPPAHVGVEGGRP